MYFKVEEGFKLSTLEFLNFLPRKNYHVTIHNIQNIYIGITPL
jgi:hypothetical protein